MNPITKLKGLLASSHSKLCNHYIGANFQRGRDIVLDPGMLYIGDNVFIGDYVRLTPNTSAISIADGSFIQAFCVLLAGDFITIGCNVLIGPHTVIVSADHRFDRRDIPITQQGLTCEWIVIQDDVWIGAHCTILKGTKIGQGSVIGAGSVVTGRVDPYSIMAGNPAKLIGKR